MLIGMMTDIAHRRDSAPNDGFNKSLSKPTTSGPKPKPIRLSTRNKMAEVSARIEAGTRLCATETAGPRYMLCNEAHKPKQNKERDVLCKKQRAGRKNNR